MKMHKAGRGAWIALALALTITGCSGNVDTTSGEESESTDSAQVTEATATTETTTPAEETTTTITLALTTTTVAEEVTTTVEEAAATEEVTTTTVADATVVTAEDLQSPEALVESALQAMGYTTPSQEVIVTDIEFTCDYLGELTFPIASLEELDSAAEHFSTKLSKYGNIDGLGDIILDEDTANVLNIASLMGTYGCSALAAEAGL